MDKRETVVSVRRAWDFVKGHGLSEYLRQYEPVDVNEEYRRMALGGARTYAELYESALNLQVYNLMLRDFSVFQFSWFGDADLRYAFMPNPYLRYSVDGELIDEVWASVSGGAASIEEALHELSDAVGESGVPLVRYENATHQRLEHRHPCSHFHIGFDAENRWAVRRVLTPYSFVMLIVKLYYPNAWLQGCAPEEASANEVLLMNERRDNCRVLPPALFSNAESESFHVA